MTGLATDSSCEPLALLKYTFPLSEGRQFELSLPKDLTYGESFRLGEFINTLVIVDKEDELEDDEFEENFELDEYE